VILLELQRAVFCTHPWFKITFKIPLATSIKAMFNYLIEFEMQNSNHQSRTISRTNEAQDNVIPGEFIFFLSLLALCIGL
jgi:hypothetical protein